MYTHSFKTGEVAVKRTGAAYLLFDLPLKNSTEDQAVNTKGGAKNILPTMVVLELDIHIPR